jgi:hypothetical protein
MPTRLGDILRAAEARPTNKYGLDTIVCWYALWLLLPAETETELVQARAALDKAAGTWLWGALFLVWTPWTWWAVPIAVVVPALAYYIGILGAARPQLRRSATRGRGHRMKGFAAPSERRTRRSRAPPRPGQAINGPLIPGGKLVVILGPEPAEEATCDGTPAS